MNRTMWKRQLYISVITILVTALALTSATYAWFENTAQAAVRTLDVTVGTSMLLEISTEKDGGYKYELKSSDIDRYIDNLKTGSRSGDPTLKAVSSADCASFFALTGAPNSQGLYDTFRLVDEKDGYYLELPVYLRGNRDMKVYLSDETSVRMENDRGDMDKSLRIGFKTDGGTVIFEPNEDTVADRKNTTANIPREGYAITSASGSYAAQETRDSDELFVKFTGKSGEDGDIADLNNTDAKNKTELAELKAGKAEAFNIYIWIEGTDFDCVGNLENGTLLVDLKFIGVIQE